MIRLPRSKAQEAVRDAERAITGMKRARLHTKDADEARDELLCALERQRRFMLVAGAAAVAFGIPFLVLDVVKWNDGILPKIGVAALLVADSYAIRSWLRLYRAKL